MSSPGSTEVRLLVKSDVESGFSCGESTLDTFFRKRAWDHQQAGVSRVFVLADTAKPDQILGFYTLAAKVVERDVITALLRGSFPRYPLPVVYIGYFGTLAGQQRRGLGRALMADALHRCLHVSASLGTLGVFLDSLSEDSTAFYRALGFSEVGQSMLPQSMFLPMATLRASIG